MIQNRKNTLVFYLLLLKCKEIGSHSCLLEVLDLKGFNIEMMKKINCKIPLMLITLKFL